jgi:1-acyl-sn-glycerol-3-phosphate acyltransferase
MLRLFRRIRRAFLICVHLIDGALLCLFWLVPLRVLYPRALSRARSRLTRWWMRGLLRAIGVRVHCKGRAHPAPVLFVANHISWLDIPCLLACTDGLFVAKHEVARWPLIGALARQIGTLFLERGQGAAKTVQHMISALARGERLVLFPEGTSTDGREVRPFHARLYQAATDSRVPVQAIALSYPFTSGPHPRVPFVGDDNFVSHLWRLLGEAGIDARVEFCAPILAHDAQRSDLAVRTRNLIIASLRISAGDLRRRVPVVTHTSPAVQRGFIQSRNTGAVATGTRTVSWKTVAKPTPLEAGVSSSMHSTRL